MFKRYGWKLVDNVEDADLIQFTGGEDVTPSYYGHQKHPRTWNNPMRDQHEKLVWDLAQRENKVCAGICRGGQFLNVMCGGKMYQDVSGHLGGHMAVDTQTGETFLVTSTHHQMMIPNEETGHVVVTARESTMRVSTGPEGQNTTFREQGLAKKHDTEAVLYAFENTFCFQPHPEFQGHEDLADRYMGYLVEFFQFDLVFPGRKTH